MQIDVKTTGGVVRGVADEPSSTIAFLGVPYAEAPFDRNRFGEPVPTSWDGVRECTTYGATAPQPAQGFTIIPEPIIPGRECLNCNVFTPAIGDARLPVLVWIHGGGFTNGCNASAWYHGRSFCRDGVVVVAINYRLGIEGFLPLEGAPANRALLDWLLALEWVHDNIAAFGGDPGNVTVAGQSAGGVACATLLTTPKAEGLLHKAIFMSGVANHLRTIDEVARFARRVATTLGVSATREGFASVDPDRMVTVQTEMGTLGDDHSGSPERSGVAGRFGGIARGAMRYGPVIDGDLVPASPLDAIAGGVGSDVPVLLGTTSEEADAMARMAGEVDEETAIAALVAAGLSDADARIYRDAFAGESPTEVLGHAITDAMFRVPAVRVAEARGGSNTWMYESRWRSPTGFGAVHCLDIPFAFDLLDAEGVSTVAGDQPPQHLADTMHRAWVDFMRTGDPGWEPYDTNRRRVMAFDEECRVVEDPHAPSREHFSGRRSER